MIVSATLAFQKWCAEWHGEKPATLDDAFLAGWAMACDGIYAVPEPVAWVWVYRDGLRSLRWRPDWNPISSDVPDRVEPLYASPPDVPSKAGEVVRLADIRAAFEHWCVDSAGYSTEEIAKRTTNPAGRETYMTAIENDWMVWHAAACATLQRYVKNCPHGTPLNDICGECGPQRAGGR